MTPPPSIQTTAAACEAKKWFRPESTPHRNTDITRYVTQVRAMKRRKRDLDEAVPRPPAELIDELAIHIADGRNVLFITGAGLSVSAGIPAFRSGAGAVWEENVVQYGTRKSLRKDPVEWHNAFW